MSEKEDNVHKAMTYPKFIDHATRAWHMSRSDADSKWNEIIKDAERLEHCPISAQVVVWVLVSHEHVVKHLETLPRMRGLTVHERRVS